MITNLEQLYIDQLRDLYSAEKQLIAALPEMAAHASHEELRDAFNHHLQETKEQQRRLQEIFDRHGLNPEGEECDAMRGLIKEAGKHIPDTSPGSVRDAVLIACANRVEHYEIAAYGVAKAFADCLGYHDDVKTLGKTLEEEGNADQTITRIATGGLFRSGVNEEALH
ncbi:ferritin-like domain-containing protein [Luteolibacter luteus]|uniref:Ferritin-like domain-containing protein n=1 Tax=Luteolibacter luteus TaxID=2728835 RepID=A0A858RLV5_9BACT|nr:ferritin-like domain-containing protein [Luteolibacter luteus]QJE97359.1 ferritin-like domain-containing protein [Luteolibacter luteus]